jgi:NitT/TauT family transport system ATP-binding protein
MTIVFVTHDVEEAVVLADRVAVVSPRPATIREIIDIELSRPRDPTHTQVTRYIQQLRELI